MTDSTGCFSTYHVAFADSLKEEYVIRNALFNVTF